jgi:hypothetical protein
MYLLNIPLASELLTYTFQIPLSQGGAAFPWDSALVISMLVVGVVLVVAFLLVEWKLAPLPVVPCKFCVQ